MAFSMSGVSDGYSYNRFDIYEKKSKDCDCKPKEDCDCDDKKSKGKGGARWQDSDGDGKWYEPGEDVATTEGYQGKHGQSDKEYADSRSDGGKMISGDSKMSGAEFTHGRRVKADNPGMQPDVGGKTKPKSQGKMDKGTRNDLMYRKANLKKEELELTGLFSEEEISTILEALLGKN